IGFAGSDTNLYGFTHNDPVSATDPSGLLEWLQDPQPSGRISISVVREFIAINLGWTERWVGYLDPTSGIVQRGSRFAFYEDVQAAGYQDDWDAWFRDNDLMQLWAAASRPIDQLPRGTDTRDTGGMSTWRSSWIAHDPGYRRQLQLIS